MPTADERRASIWRAKCLFHGCGYTSIRGPQIRTDQKALNHAEKNRGHNVAVTYLMPEGETFHHVSLRRPSESNSEQPAF